MGEFVFPETLKRMRNWDQDQGKERRDDRGASQPSTGLFVNKSKINHHNFEGKTVTSDQKSHPSQVWNQKFSLEMSFSQVGEIFRLGHQTKDDNLMFNSSLLFQKRKKFFYIDKKVMTFTILQFQTALGDSSNTH